MAKHQENPGNDFQVALNGRPGVTFRQVTTDTVAGFPTSTDTLAVGSSTRAVVGAVVTVEDNNVRYGLGGAIPSQGASQLGHLVYAGGGTVLRSRKAYKTFLILSDVAGAAGVLQVTPFYQF